MQQRRSEAKYFRRVEVGAAAPYEDVEHDERRMAERNGEAAVCTPSSPRACAHEPTPGSEDSAGPAELAAELPDQAGDQAGGCAGAQLDGRLDVQLGGQQWGDQADAHADKEHTEEHAASRPFRVRVLRTTTATSTMTSTRPPSARLTSQRLATRVRSSETYVEAALERRRERTQRQLQQGLHRSSTGSGAQQLLHWTLERMLCAVPARGHALLASLVSTWPPRPSRPPRARCERSVVELAPLVDE
jgi:hypothetical protein